VQALIHLGRLHARTDNTAQAMDRLREAVQHGGDYPDVHCLLGELYRRDNRLDQARASYQRALELNAHYGRAQEALAAIGAA
jgi:Tfp pilus assembly protein PilF